MRNFMILFLPAAEFQNYICCISSNYLFKIKMKYYNMQHI